MTNLNHGLFRQFISTLSNAAGGFINAFDSNNDKIVVKAEFQAKMWANQSDYVNNWDGNANNTTEYRDLINEFWNSFDDIYKKGNINNTNIEHAYALDSTEIKDIQREMDLYFQITQIEHFSELKQYAHTYNFITQKIADTIKADKSGNTTITDNDFKNLLADILTEQSPEFKEAILKDALEMVVSKTNYTHTDGYNPLNDSELISRVASKIATLTFKNGENPVQAVVDYFNETQGENFKDMRIITSEYLGDTTKADPQNNYQIARLTNAYLAELNDYIKQHTESEIPEDSELFAKAQEKGKETIDLAVNALLSQNKDSVGIDNLYNTINNIENTEPGKIYKNYLYTLSLADFNKTDDKDYYEKLVTDLSSEEGFLKEDAEIMIDYLANNDTTNSEYQALVELVANVVYSTGITSQEEIWKLISEAITNGGFSIDDPNSILDYIKKQVGFVEKTISWLSDKIWLAPNSNKRVDVVDFYIDGNNSTDVDYNIIRSSTDTNYSVSIDKNGIIDIKSNSSEGNFNLEVEVIYNGISIGTKTIQIQISKEKPDWCTDLDFTDWALRTKRTSAQDYTDNNYSDQDDVKKTLKNNVNTTISNLYSFLNARAKDEGYNSEALNKAQVLTNEFFDKLIDNLQAHKKVENSGKGPGWTAVAEFNLTDGTLCTITYNQESHQGYIDADKNQFDSTDNIEWIRGTMAGARFAKIGIKNSFIYEVFNLFYNRCLNNDKGNIKL